MDLFVAGLLGMAGALVPEVLRVVACLRANKAPKGRELLASALVVLLGLGVLLFDTAGQSRLQVAVTGAAFPQLFSGLVAAASKAPSKTRGTARRRLIDYLAWRLA